MDQAKPGFAKRAYLALRWPFVLAFLIISGIYFIVGLLNSLGYQGTTSLRPSQADSAEWKEFQGSFQGIKGAPYMWKTTRTRPVVGLVNFDTRLVKELNYLRNDKDTACGWSGTHELIELDNESGKFSDLILPPTRTMSLSTLYRGVGIRFSKADKVKCTIEPVDPALPLTCPEAPAPRSFAELTIPLTVTDLGNVKATEPYSPGCKVTCASDYYPHTPADKASDPSEVTPPKYSTAVTSLIPEVGEFDYKQINTKIHDIAALKIITLAVELMNTDNKGCANKLADNTGSNRLIPISLILPDWVLTDLGDGWRVMKEAAANKFPFSFQKGSPLAGLTHDPNLNDKGLHLNY